MLVHKRTTFFEGKTIKKKKKNNTYYVTPPTPKEKKIEQDIQKSHIKKRKFVFSRFDCCTTKYTPINSLHSVRKLVL